MFHFGKVPAIGLSLAALALSTFLGAAASAPSPPPSVPVSTPVVQASQPQCRASNGACDIQSGDAQCIDTKVIDAQIQSLRQSCALELEAFAKCRASRPAWDSVELFGCGFEMSTSLARGDVEDPASLADCGTAEGASLESPALRRGNMECPVPACEGELEALEAEPAC